MCAGGVAQAVERLIASFYSLGGIKVQQQYAIYIFFWRYGVWTQGFILARQVLYRFCYSLSPAFGL
jgi:hypothetical protein